LRLILQLIWFGDIEVDTQISLNNIVTESKPNSKMRIRKVFY